MFVRTRRIVDAGEPSVLAALMPLLATVLVGFLVIGAAMPVLPLHVRDGLGFGPFMVGIVAGCQFAAALVARVWSGHSAGCARPQMSSHGRPLRRSEGLPIVFLVSALVVLCAAFVSLPLVRRRLTVS
jgi:hypothetical protein